MKFFRRSSSTQVRNEHAKIVAYPARTVALASSLALTIRTEQLSQIPGLRCSWKYRRRRDVVACVIAG